MLKHASIDVHNILIILVGLCYRAQVILTQWKLTSLFPILKPKDWDYNITNTRPILLIECVWKLTVKILNNRLSVIFTEHNILKGPNYAGLKGCSTSIPIHTICNIMEDAREKKKELWIVAQDMAKVFDSVGLTPLRRALQRIKVPTQTIDFVTELFE